MHRIPLAVVTLTAALAAGAAHADHNSPFGEGWAQMPNDAHDDAVERVTDELRADATADGAEMRADMVEQFDDMESIRSGMAEAAAEAREEAGQMADDVRGSAADR
ncbi:MAG TPA: hypothetical protein VKA55_09665 [Gammaproteobacteria bacterium]|nr:hypothetical protein [Gammaproteobacteria bacterium]